MFAAAVCCLLFADIGTTGKPDSGPFPKISGKFGSKSLSYPMRGDFIDYGSKLKVIFDDGTLYRRRDGVSYDYYFLGAGRLVIHDTTGLDASWQTRFSNAATVKFISAYVCGEKFADGLMLDNSQWREDKIDREHWQKLQFLVKAPERYFWVDLSGELGIWPRHDPFPLPVWVDLELETGEQVVLYLSPDITEQLNIYLYDKKFDSPYLLAGFNLDERLGLAPVEIDSSVISINLQESGNFDAVSTIFFPPGTDPRGIKLNLPELFKVDSAQDADGKPLPFLKDKNRVNFYIGPRPDALDRPDRVTVFYRGKFIRARLAGVDLPVNVTTWFPHLPRRNLGRFTIHYSLHKDLELISVGRKIGEEIVRDRKTVTYQTDDISYVSFASGVYDTLRETAQDVPLTLYIRRENNQGIFNRHIPRNVMADLRDAFSAYYRWYGPPLAASLRIVDQPWSAGQSSPGLIHLSEISFETRRDQARFRAHEVAHQWWGHTVVPKSFREMWLSEGLAEMSSALYLLNVKRDTTAYRNLLSHWRRQIVQEGRMNGIYSRGYRAGAITMGARLLLSYSPGDYIALVYFKAAYMLEMLRFEIDGPDYRTDFFNSMLADYRRSFAEKQASSVDFMRIAQTFLGPKRAQAFFKQWLYGWKIPDFTCRYAFVPDAKGRLMLHVFIDVSGIDGDFATPYPVEIEFADGSKRIYRIDGVGQMREHVLGPFPEDVTAVRFDPDHIILDRHTEVIMGESNAGN